MLFIILLLLLISNNLYAEVSINNEHLPINNSIYDISPDLGQKVGNHLFYTFNEFNLNDNEIAQFSGSETIQNVISRVIGDQPSLINGTIRSILPNANFYFLNPQGIVFGETAKLQVPNSFYASTADYISLADGGEFHARFPERDVLTVAPITSFGFLTEPVAAIEIQNSMLKVAPTKNLAFIGGDLHVTGQSPVEFDEHNIYAKTASALLLASQGHIYLVSADSQSQVSFQHNMPTLIGQGRHIQLHDTMVDVSGLGAGGIFIRGHNVTVKDSVLQTNNLGTFNGLGLDIRLIGSLEVTSQYPLFNSLVSKNFGAGDGAQIFLQAAEVKLHSIIAETATFLGNAGNITLEVQKLSLTNGADISADTIAAGTGGHINIHATDSILISGYKAGSHILDGSVLTNMPSGIGGVSAPRNGRSSLGLVSVSIHTGQLDMVEGVISTSTIDESDAGSVRITADNITMRQGSLISSGSLNKGKAGDIHIQVANQLLISGRREGITIVDETQRDVIGHDTVENTQSTILSGSLTGLGGEINIEAKDIQLTQGGLISSASMGLGESTSHINIIAERLSLASGGQINNSNGLYTGNVFLSGTGNGSNINIQTQQLSLTGLETAEATPTGIFTDTYSLGHGGNILIQADHLNLNTFAAISARSFGVGDAGKIQIHANQAALYQHSIISTASDNAGGGNIELDIQHLLYLDRGQISTSVKTGQGSGGNITIAQPTFVVLHKAQLIAQADTGQGGNIRIIADQFLTSPHSLVSASSRLGINGNIEVSSPDETVSGNLLHLTKQFVKQMEIEDACRAAIAGQLPTEFQPPFSFKVDLYHFPNYFIEDWIPSDVYHDAICH